MRTRGDRQAIIESGNQGPEVRAKALALRAGIQEQPEKKLADLDEAVRLAPRRRGAVPRPRTHCWPTWASWSRRWPTSTRPSS